MAQDALSLRVSEISDPALLFECYNTEEIRGIERKVRGEIEQKREELRQMVGERYRDLIDAADTIGEMKQCSESVVQSIQDMQQYCHRLKQGRASVASCRVEVSQTPCVDACALVVLYNVMKIYRNLTYKAADSQLLRKGEAAEPPEHSFVTEQCVVHSSLFNTAATCSTQAPSGRTEGCRHTTVQK